MARPVRPAFAVRAENRCLVLSSVPLSMVHGPSSSQEPCLQRAVVLAIDKLLGAGASVVVQGVADSQKLWSTVSRPRKGAGARLVRPVAPRPSPLGGYMRRCYMPCAMCNASGCGLLISGVDASDARAPWKIPDSSSLPYMSLVSLVCLVCLVFPVPRPVRDRPWLSCHTRVGQQEPSDAEQHLRDSEVAAAAAAAAGPGSLHDRNATLRLRIGEF